MGETVTRFLSGVAFCSNCGEGHFRLLFWIHVSGQDMAGCDENVPS